jgi:hypothetical protein
LGDAVNRKPRKPAPEEPRSFAGSPPGCASDSGDPAGASANETPAADDGHDRALKESHPFAQLGLTGLHGGDGASGSGLLSAGLVDDETADAPPGGREGRPRLEPMDELDLNEIAADDAGASAFAERAQKEAER